MRGDSGDNGHCAQLRCSFCKKKASVCAIGGTSSSRQQRTEIYRNCHPPPWTSAQTLIAHSTCALLSTSAGRTVNRPPPSTLRKLLICTGPTPPLEGVCSFGGPRIPRPCCSPRPAAGRLRRRPGAGGRPGRSEVGVVPGVWACCTLRALRSWQLALPKLCEWEKPAHNEGTKAASASSRTEAASPRVRRGEAPA